MHDVTDNTCVQSWFNSPVTGALGADIYKATNIVRAFRTIGKMAPESGIPASVLHGAAGFAILSIAKVGGFASPGLGYRVQSVDPNGHETFHTLMCICVDFIPWTIPVPLHHALHSVGWQPFESDGMLPRLLLQSWISKPQSLHHTLLYKVPTDPNHQ